MRVAHLSDLHALPDSPFEGTAPWHWAGKRLAGWLNLRLNRRQKHPVAITEALVDDVARLQPDHVVVTGDLVNLSLTSEFRLARQLLERLDLPPSRVTLVPGNHDVYTVDAWLSGAFQREFAPYLTSDDGGTGYPVVRVRDELALIGISTARPSPVPFADGRIGRAQLERVERALERLASRFRLVLLHHPPVDNRHALLRALRDRRALQAVLRRAGAELVLHGHEHRDLRAVVAGPTGPIPVIGVASGSYSDPRPDRRARYNVYELREGRLAAIERRLLGVDLEGGRAPFVVEPLPLPAG
jgi:3',5'-cyclic AMP phosphodiesterase CpdA